MRLFLVLFLCLGGIACVESSVDAEHPETGLMHYPAGICASGDWIHVISSNHDQRFSSGALLSFRAGDLDDGSFDVQSVRHGSNGLPTGFGRVLDLAFCGGAKLGLLDRAQKQLVVVPFAEDGSIADDLGDLSPVELAQADPGHGVLHGDWILLGSRVEESAAVLGPVPERAAGVALSRRPIRGGAMLLPVSGLEAVALTEDGLTEELSQVGWNGSLDGLAQPDGAGLALHRTGKAVIEYTRRGEQLVMTSSTDLSAQHRRMMRGLSEGSLEELWFFGGEPVLELHGGDPQQLMDLWFDPRFVRLEDGVPLGESSGRALFTSFVPAGLEEGAPLIKVSAADRSVELLR